MKAYVNTSNYVQKSVPVHGGWWVRFENENLSPFLVTHADMFPIMVTFSYFLLICSNSLPTFIQDSFLAYCLLVSLGGGVPVKIC